MADRESNKTDERDDLATEVVIDPTRLIEGIHGIFRTLDQADFASADWKEADRLSQLVAAGLHLADQLAHVTSEWRVGPSKSLAGINSAHA